MTSVLTPQPDLIASPSDVPAADSDRRRARWPWFGVGAGIAGLVASFASVPGHLDDEDYLAGPAVIDELDRGTYHVAFVLGLVSVAMLLVTAAAWRRWASERAPDSLAARTIGAGIAATAAVNIIGTALCGSMAIYMPGGMDEGTMSQEALFVNFAMLDFGTLFGWWGVVVAAIAVAALAFGRGRLLPRWIGIVSAALVTLPIVAAVVTGLPGLPGFFMPVWLTVVSLGMAFGRSARA